MIYSLKNKELIGFDNFEQVDFRVGTVVEVDAFERAKKPAYQLTIDFGPLGVLKSSAQISTCYSIPEMIGRQVVAVVNLPPKQVGKHTSRCLILGAVHSGHVGLLSVPSSVPNGTRIH